MYIFFVADDHFIYLYLLLMMNIPMSNSTPKKLSINSNRKVYTLEQIRDHVQTIQKYSDQFALPTHSSCFYSLKKITKIFQNRRRPTLEHVTSSIEYKSPFKFGGDTLQWIALPSQIESHIYENDFFIE